ncbi:MAG TPA: cadmium resistance transporter [Polyangiaceae bacterium]|nr:cadmium resistance transporter [Polyangiaceae bacterium]
MNDLLAALGVGAVVFASTNVDDMLLLAAFFAEPAFSRRQVVAGQFLGMSALVAVSAACALLAFAVPPGWVGLLGLVPLGLGVVGLIRRFAAGEAEAESHAERPRSGQSRTLAVAGVTIANGGDNLGVYIPLFSSDMRRLVVYVAVFASMTAAWCVAGYYLVENPLFGKRFAHYGRLALPFVLIALGCWILRDAAVLLE